MFDNYGKTAVGLLNWYGMYTSVTPSHDCRTTIKCDVPSFGSWSRLGIVCAVCCHSRTPHSELASCTLDTVTRVSIPLRKHPDSDSKSGLRNARGHTTLDSEWITRKLVSSHEWKESVDSEQLLTDNMGIFSLHVKFPKLYLVLINSTQSLSA